MEIGLLAVIGIGLGTMFFGYFFGLFEGRGQGYKKRKQEEAVPPYLETHSSAAPTATENPASEDRNLLALRRDDGELLLRLNGQLVSTSNISSEQRRRLIEIMVMLRPWVEPTAAPAPPRSTTPSATGAASSRSVTPTRAARGAESPSIAGIAAPPGPTSPATLSLVQQIDAILQARLENTPLGERGIRLAEALHGGAIVFIGQAQYDGVDKVPDPEVQAAIRSAIAEWEKRATPG